jgi:hypothetical protein
MNAPDAFLLPFDFEVGGELASLLHIVTATFFYFVFVLFAALASHFSEMIEQSKAWLIYVAIICFLSLYSIIFNASQPKVSIYFTILSAIILLSYVLKKHSSNVSHIATNFLGAIASLICFTSGVLWYFDYPIFQSAVAAAFGFEQLSQSSYKVGAVMLFSMGYVIYYGVFKLNEIYYLIP